MFCYLHFIVVCYPILGSRIFSLSFMALNLFIYLLLSSCSTWELFSVVSFLPYIFLGCGSLPLGMMVSSWTLQYTLAVCPVFMLFLIVHVSANYMAQFWTYWFWLGILISCGWLCPVPILGLENYFNETLTR